MEPLIIDSIIEKIDASVYRLDEQEKTISDISQKILVITDQSDAIKNVSELIKRIQENISAIRWPIKEMTEMSSRLATNNELLANPRKTKKVIFHTAGRILWVVIGLSLGIVFLTMGWINTSNKLEQFRMHDIIWRFVKSTNHSQNLEYLHSVETLYLENPEKMESFVSQEELSQKQLEESDPKSIKDYPIPPKSQIHINAKIKRK